MTCPATGSDWSNYTEISDSLFEVTKGMHDVYLYFENNTGKPYVTNVRLGSASQKLLLHTSTAGLRNGRIMKRIIGTNAPQRAAL